MELNPKTYEPNIELTEFVKRYWTLDGEKENIPLKNTIIPDGTMKLIFYAVVSKLSTALDQVCF